MWRRKNPTFIPEVDVGKEGGKSSACFRCRLCLLLLCLTMNNNKEDVIHDNNKDGNNNDNNDLSCYNKDVTIPLLN